MTDLDLFASAGDGLSPEHFGINEHGRVFVEAPAFARVLEYSSTQMALKQVDDAEWGYSDRLTPGGVQRMKVIYEDGIWELIFRSTLPSAKAIKARVKVILRQLRETGVVDTRQRPVAELPDRRALAQMVIEAEDRADVEKTRADVAEDALRKMRAAGGLNLRTFRKTHFPDVGEKVLLAHCYRKGYLIDQRPSSRTGSRATTGLRSEELSDDRRPRRDRDERHRAGTHPGVDPR